MSLNITIDVNSITGTIEISELADLLRRAKSSEMREFCAEIASDSDVQSFFREHFKVDELEERISELEELNKDKDLL